MAEYNNVANNSSAFGWITMGENGELEPPKNAIPSVYVATGIYTQYRQDHINRILLYSQIEGLIAGNPPYDVEDLIEHGLSHVSNFNNLDARSLFERASLAYWNLLYQAEFLTKFELGQSTADEKEAADILSQEFDRVIRQWPNFKTVVNTLIAQLVKFGLSPVFWSDERDWRWDVIELQRFFVSSMATTNTEELTCVCVESIFTAQYLFDIYMQYKDTDGEGEGDAKSPWDIKELEYLLLHYANLGRKQGDTIKDIFDLQVLYQNAGNSWDSIYTDGFRLVSMFYKEYDGEISHYMFDRTRNNGQFLYFIDRQYKCFEEALILFTASPGEFKIHSNRGVGHKIFAGCQAMMQIDCAMVDMAKFASTPCIQSISTGAKDPEQIRFYPGTPTHIGSAQFAQTNFGANIGQLVSASQYILQKMNYNAANSGDDPARPDNDIGSLSPTQARLKSYREFAVLRNNIQHFYSFMDLVYQNMVAKMLASKPGYPGYQYAKEWKERCIARGFPEKVFDQLQSETNRSKIKRNLPKELDVKASRVAGDGSTVGLMLGLEGTAPIMGGVGPRGVNAFNKLVIQANLGQDYVDTFLQDAGTPDESAGGASLAAVENAIMNMGQSPVVSPDNDQRSHISIHMAFLNDIIRRVQQQTLSPIEADKLFDLGIPHTAEHIQIYSQSPFSKPFMDKILGPWGEVEKYAAFNKKNAAQMAQAEIKKRQEDAEKTQQVMDDAQRKDFVAQSNQDIKDRSTTAAINRADKANDTRAQIKEKEAQDKAANERLRITLENENKKVQNERESSSQPITPLATSPTDLSKVPMETLRATVDNLAGARPGRYDFENAPETPKR